MKALTFITLLLGASLLHAQIDTRIGAPPASSADSATSPSDKDGSDTEKKSDSETKPSQQLPSLAGIQVEGGSTTMDELSVSGHVTGIADSRARQTPQGAELGYASQVGGQARLQHTWGQASLLAQYAGGVSAGDTANLGQDYEEVALTQTYWHGRWHFMAGGRFTYLPESSFGFNVFRSIPDVNASLDSTGLPGQTVFTQPATQMHTVAVSEVDYRLDRLSSLTMYGLFSRQTFDNSALLNTNQIDATVAYNHVLNPRDAMAISYSFSQFDFDHTAPNLQTHSIQFFYRHRLGPRFGLRLSAGPQIRQFQNIAGETGFRTSLAASADLDVQLKNTRLDLGYLRQTTSGSGVLVGALVDQVSLSADRRLGRKLNGSLSMAYAYTSGLESFPGVPEQNFNALYAIARVDRDLTRSVNAFISYGVQVQGSQTVLGSISYPTRHLLTIGLIFHPQAVRLH